MKKLLSLVIIIIIIFIFNETKSKNITKEVTQVKKIEYSAWITDWDEARAINSLNSNAGNKISEILPVWYKIDSSGSIIEIPSDNKDIVTEIAKQKNIKITPTLVNSDSSGFNPKLVTKLLTQKNSTINYLVETAQKNNYYGWDLDLEEISQFDRNDYTEFTKLLAQELHKSNLKLSITVHAKTRDDSWEGTKGQDVVELGKNADFVRVMAYDFHNSDSIAGPITPIEDLESTIEFIKSQVDINKIVIALPTYGYDWQNGKKGIPHQFQEIKTIINLKNAENFRDLNSQELKATYEDHKIWYVDSTTLTRLIDITKSYGINNICFWRLGGEDETLWNSI